MDNNTNPICLYQLDGTNIHGRRYRAFMLAQSALDVENILADLNPHMSMPILIQQPLAMVRNTLPPRTNGEDNDCPF
jgi:hypothetical protein